MWRGVVWCGVVWWCVRACVRACVWCGGGGGGGVVWCGVVWCGACVRAVVVVVVRTVCLYDVSIYAT